MDYQLTTTAYAGKDASLSLGGATLAFGTSGKGETALPSPAELFLGSIAACILKNVERFSGLLEFEYESAVLTLQAKRMENPPLWRISPMH